MIEMDMPKIDVEENESKSYAKIVVEPLEKGFGLTIGNCLRRILLSALPGAAVQGIRFYPDGLVKHEFSALPGIKEDVPEIPALPVDPSRPSLVQKPRKQPQVAVEIPVLRAAPALESASGEAGPGGERELLRAQLKTQRFDDL